MKLTLYPFMICLLCAYLALLSGCGRSESPPGIHIEFKMPETMKKGGARYQALLKRAICLEIKLKTEGGVDYENRFSPSSWDNLSLPMFNFPANEKDVMHINVLIWDRQKDGTQRSHAVMSGKKAVRAKDLSESDRTIVVPLSLKIEPGNFDGP